MKIKFIRSCAVYAEHREAGSVHEIADLDANQLIADGSAITVIESETAESKHLKKETAAKK